MVKLPSVGVAALRGAITSEESNALGRVWFPPDNWHQSLSSVKYTSDAAIIEAMRRAGARISATAVTMVLSYLGGIREHWRLQPRGIPESFRALLDAVESALDEALGSDTRKTPHSTVSVRSPLEILRRAIRPVAWALDEIFLIEGAGSPYQHDVLNSCALAPHASHSHRHLSN